MLQRCHSYNHYYVNQGLPESDLVVLHVVQKGPPIGRARQRVSHSVPNSPWLVLLRRNLQQKYNTFHMLQVAGTFHML